MATKAEHQSNIQKYQHMQAQMQKILPKLSTLSKSIGRVEKEVEATYRIDDKGSQVAVDISIIYNDIDFNIKLFNQSIPIIDEKIQEEEAEIQNIEKTEAEEAAETQAPSFRLGGGGHYF